MPASVHFHLGQRREAEDLARRWHYSHRPPANATLIGSWHLDGGLFGDTGPMVAACFFSPPAVAWSEQVLELSRLVRAESELPPLSGLVAATVKAIKLRGVGDLLVSYADPSHGHHGGIYQACSWRFGELRPPRQDGVIVAGQYVNGRTANRSWGTQSVARLAERGVTAEATMDGGKYLYWLPIGKAGLEKAQRLGLQSSAYPKPEVALA